MTAGEATLGAPLYSHQYFALLRSLDPVSFSVAAS